MNAKIHLKKNSVKGADDAVHEGNEKLQHTSLTKTYFYREWGLRFTEHDKDGLAGETEVAIRN